MRPHPQIQRLDPAQDQHCRQRRHHRPGHVLDADEADLLNVRGPAHYQPCDHIAMTAQIFGRRMHNDICTVLDGPRQNRRGIGVVHHHLRAVAMRDLADRGNVH